MEQINNSWVDPREVDEDDFKWRYLNGFHYANAVKEIIDYIEGLAEQAEELVKIEKGEVQQEPRIGG